MTTPHLTAPDHTASHQTVLRFLAAPTDVGTGTQVHTGRILEWIDKAAYALAAGWSGGYAVTAYVGNVRFSRPIASGDLVEVSARLVHTGTSSMHIQCDVRACDPARTGYRHCAECLVVFIAVRDGAPTPVPAWRPASSLEIHESDEAVMRIGLRKDIERAMAQQVYSEAGTAPRSTLRLLAAPSDVNWGGNAHGGRIMAWIDDAANLCAAQWSGTPCTSGYAGGVRFYHPVRIGDVVEVEARLLHTGHETMHVSVHVRSGAATSSARTLSTHCLTVCAALGADGRPTPVARWSPVSAEDHALDAHARDLVRLRARGRSSRRAPASS
ncbi:acyl-CoA thioesterase [Dietzia cinnamea]|uniref:acyl-CoA thioesterase n=1 Tax=Dietzia cinnamea TaxID=321318 RepID=UPI0021A47A16|nr:acyl-CoA thioesterase [Dietzia cinnamea]MCT2059361.1 acyl-CoA thioesterase [Dietzia cinnamea]MCT2121039.1 acyl-CoA thioesterase [Dietzia cinnamea]MCT2144525.1 acyl-CoA thioesterase [Dietzia cinnamea]MCT2305204.1 acyl-CoA thioesterase [Dietzia cinnamea]